MQIPAQNGRLPEVRTPVSQDSLKLIAQDLAPIYRGEDATVSTASRIERAAELLGRRAAVSGH
jgi:hypothetical protein